MMKDFDEHKKHLDQFRSHEMKQILKLKDDSLLENDNVGHGEEKEKSVIEFPKTFLDSKLLIPRMVNIKQIYELINYVINTSYLKHRVGVTEQDIKAINDRLDKND